MSKRKVITKVRVTSHKKSFVVSDDGGQFPAATWKSLNEAALDAHDRESFYLNEGIVDGVEVVGLSPTLASERGEDNVT
jgi:hypothetical protein